MIFSSLAAIDVQSILNLELEPKVKPIPLPSPTFPIPGSAEVLPKQSSPQLPSSPIPPPPSVSSPVSHDESIEQSSESVEPQESEQESNTSTKVVDVSMEEDTTPTKDDTNDDGSDPNLYYTPDEEENEVVTQREPVFEEPESVSYVPPFNNPIYPNDSYASYTSAIGKLQVQNK